MRLVNNERVFDRASVRHETFSALSSPPLSSFLSPFEDRPTLSNSLESGRRKRRLKRSRGRGGRRGESRNRKVLEISPGDPFSMQSPYTLFSSRDLEGVRSSSCHVFHSLHSHDHDHDHGTGRINPRRSTAGRALPRPRHAPGRRRRRVGRWTSETHNGKDKGLAQNSQE